MIMFDEKFRANATLIKSHRATGGWDRDSENSSVNCGFPER